MHLKTLQKESLITQESTENFSTLLDTNDRAWNDPPTVAYNLPHSEKNTPQKRLLNKRVAYPQSSNISPNHESESLKSGLTSPPLAAHLNPTEPPKSEATSKQLNNNEVLIKTKEIPNIDDSSLLEKSSDEMKAEIQKILEKCFESIKKNMEDRKSDDVRRKLDVFYKNWDECKLEPAIQHRMYFLCKEIEKENVDSADSMHLKLTMDYFSQVKSWMVAVKNIIYEMKQLNTASIISKTLEVSTVGNITVFNPHDVQEK
ncbi:Steroid receptor RNA activator 1 [Nymphon striatum]|nr:Steroid receptor RNA activator 1 [Nymphon striatum]